MGATSSKGASHTFKRANRSRIMLEAQSAKLPTRARFGPASRFFLYFVLGEIHVTM